jgi:hypothetical protein
MADPTSARHLEFDFGYPAARLDGFGGVRNSIAWSLGELVGTKFDVNR